MKSDCIEYFEKRRTIRMKFPTHKICTDTEISNAFVKDFFNEPLVPSEFPDKWHQEIKPSFVSWAYRHYPACDKEVYVKDMAGILANKAYKEKILQEENALLATLPQCKCADPYCPHKGSSSIISGIGYALLASGPSEYKYYLNKWSPGEYPILVLHSSYFERSNWLSVIYSTLQEYNVVNMIRYTYGMEIENGKPMKFRKNYCGEFIEGFWFETLPTKILINCSTGSNSIEIIPTQKYLFIGMIPIFQCRFTELEVTCFYSDTGSSVESKIVGDASSSSNVESKFVINPISWHVPDERLLDKILTRGEITLDFPGYNKPWFFQLKNDCGIYFQPKNEGIKTQK